MRSIAGNEDYNSTYEELLHIAKVPSLQIRRMPTMALECFEILYKLSPPSLNDLVVLKNSNYSFRYSKTFLLSWNGNECKCNACKQF